MVVTITPIQISFQKVKTSKKGKSHDRMEHCRSCLKENHNTSPLSIPESPRSLLKMEKEGLTKGMGQQQSWRRKNLHLRWCMCLEGPLTRLLNTVTPETTPEQEAISEK